ncbi:hypothetical protein [Streptomyces sp. CB02261]|uniref:hypothetical protein n=1 Tax=Streptomyces sp. CB02261 TaxID=1703940 RepID=UPI00093D7965|nr:hypothetical protein [Streptomyces sp. CB02261]OKJ57334.1 hypothetical protein AMK29_26675 [Streptomyces sp. CB02261]
MTLWDVEVGRLADDLLELPPEPLRVLGLRVFEATLDVFGRPLEDLFVEETVAFCRRALEEFRSVRNVADFTPARREPFLEGYDWEDGKAPFAAASLSQGVAQYAGFLVGRDAEELVEALSSFYESVLSFAALGRVVSVEDEHENDLCRRAVDEQLAWISEVRGGRVTTGARRGRTSSSRRSTQACSHV